jgi:hypothetical protein
VKLPDISGGISAFRAVSPVESPGSWAVLHRQEPYSAEQAIAGMVEAGVDRALIHPMLWGPDSNELAVEAVRKYPDRFAIMGWFYLDDPERPRPRCALEGAAGHARPAVLYQRAAPAILVHRRYPRLAVARRRAPKCRWRRVRRCSCRQWARLPSATPA